ncbi:hypothetical protein STCU_10944 [Strigomonas culicis]|uniref:Trafficking protein particle complex subunit 13 N-terminal domain-containing protein n=1 Tax=Strigomonas culicis TaxID=28005 RepID=S9UQC9_9TRYP|nr:hypothetical protein STCU_10944 [Strigomonas culicis]|eukprot:EPY16856.1 hypothetical protein STCU_10944 [Strigomonas culicis]
MSGLAGAGSSTTSTSKSGAPSGVQRARVLSVSAAPDPSLPTYRSGSVVSVSGTPVLTAHSHTASGSSQSALPAAAKTSSPIARGTAVPSPPAAPATGVALAGRPLGRGAAPAAGGEGGHAVLARAYSVPSVAVGGAGGDAAGRIQRTATADIVLPPSAPPAGTTLSSPLNVNATVLRPPLFFATAERDEVGKQQAVHRNQLLPFPELAEEADDILHSVLSHPLHRLRHAAAAPRTRAAPPVTAATTLALALPSTLGSYLAGECFSALLVFQNQYAPPTPDRTGGAQTLTQLRLQVVGIGVATVPIYKADLPALPPKATYTIRVSLPIRATGRHTLSCTCIYDDNHGDSTDGLLPNTKRLAWASNVTGLEPAHVMPNPPVPPPPSASFASSPTVLSPVGRAAVFYAQQHTRLIRRRVPRIQRTRRPTGDRYVLEAMDTILLLQLKLKNYHTEPMALCDCRFTVEEAPFMLLDTPHGGAAGAAHGTCDAWLEPQGQIERQYCFTVPSEHFHATHLDGGGGSNPLGTPMRLPPPVATLGRFSYQWARQNGQGCAAAASTHVRLQRSPIIPPFDLVVLQVTTALEEEEGEEEDRDAGGPLSRGRERGIRQNQHFKAGEVLTVHCAVHCNYMMPGAAAAADRCDVALKIRPEKLAPHFIYVGATYRPLGYICSRASAAAGGDVHPTLYFTVELVAWGSGWLTLSEGLEIVEAHHAARVLYPFYLNPYARAAAGGSPKAGATGAGALGRARLDTVYLEAEQPPALRDGAGDDLLLEVEEGVDYNDNRVPLLYRLLVV